MLFEAGLCFTFSQISSRNPKENSPSNFLWLRSCQLKPRPWNMWIWVKLRRDYQVFKERDGKSSGFNERILTTFIYFFYKLWDGQAKTGSTEDIFTKLLGIFTHCANALESFKTICTSYLSICKLLLLNLISLMLEFMVMPLKSDLRNSCHYLVIY